MTTDREDQTVEALLAEAREIRAEPGDDLLARILLDAAGARPPRPPAAVPARASWKDWIAALGGWPALGGFAASTALGVWVGVAQPAGLTSLVPGLWPEGVSVAVGADEDPLSLLEG